MEMSYFMPFYPFAPTLMDNFAYYVPSYPFEPFLGESDATAPKMENEVKIEESAPKK
jgi:hypothetical protein